MPQLQQDFATFFMNGLGNFAPGIDLFLRPDPRGIGVSYPQSVHRGGLANDESGAGSLGVVAGHIGRGHATRRPSPGQRGHDNSVLEFQFSEGHCFK